MSADLTVFNWLPGFHKTGELFGGSKDAEKTNWCQRRTGCCRNPLWLGPKRFNDRSKGFPFGQQPGDMCQTVVGEYDLVFGWLVFQHCPCGKDRSNPVITAGGFPGPAIGFSLYPNLV